MYCQLLSTQSASEMHQTNLCNERDHEVFHVIKVDNYVSKGSNQSVRVPEQIVLVLAAPANPFP